MFGVAFLRQTFEVRRQALRLTNTATTLTRLRHVSTRFTTAGTSVSEPSAANLAPAASASA